MKTVNRQSRAISEGVLRTDQYQLTMAQLYFRLGLHETPAQFDHFFRSYPSYDGHKAGYCINAGLGWFLDWLAEASFGPTEIELLQGQVDRSGKRIFEDDFLSWLEGRSLIDGMSMRSVEEGRVVHANTPLATVKGPLALAQILETPLLNQLNYQILIASKAARLRHVARGGLLLEFGLRRGHDTGANAGARAALIGGADFSSNVGLSHLLGLEPKGTHAHSMVQVFLAMGGTELEAFRAYADVYPYNCLLLVDTVDTLESGVPNAISVFEELRAKGYEPAGIRLDSGDLAHLSIQASKMLDRAGFEEVPIVLSNNLDELVIWQIITQIETEAPTYGVDPDHLIRRLVYGVGTRLITSWGEPALGGVYKLVSVMQDGQWQPAVKVSESPEKIPNPGRKDLWRLYDQRKIAVADLICLIGEDPGSMIPLSRYHPFDHRLRSVHDKGDLSSVEPLLEEIIKDGVILRQEPDIDSIRRRRDRDLERLDPGVKRLVNPHIYHVSLSEKLAGMKQDLVRGIQRGD